MLKFHKSTKKAEDHVTTDQLKDSLNYILNASKRQMLVPKHAKLSHFPLSEGHAVISSWSLGNLIIFWDGRSRLDFNLFSLQDLEPFETIFKTTFAHWELSTREEFPRGTNRVVNFWEDISGREDGERPHWA